MRRAQEIRLMTECAPNSYKEDRHVLGLVSPRKQMINERTSPQIKQKYQLIHKKVLSIWDIFANLFRK